MSNELIQDILDWIGDKPKTRTKEINFGALPNATMKSMAHGLTPTQYGNFVRAWGTAVETNGNRLNIPYAAVTASNAVNILLTPTEIQITTGINRTTTTATVYIEYRD